MQITKITILSILIFLSFCKNKNENIDPETKRKIEIIDKIIVQNSETGVIEEFNCNRNGSKEWRVDKVVAKPAGK